MGLFNPDRAIWRGKTTDKLGFRKHTQSVCVNGLAWCRTGEKSLPKAIMTHFTDAAPVVVVVVVVVVGGGAVNWISHIIHNEWSQKKVNTTANVETNLLIHMASLVPQRIELFVLIIHIPFYTSGTLLDWSNNTSCCGKRAFLIKLGQWCGWLLMR